MSPVHLPADLSQRAYRALSGEYAWSRSEVVRVLHEAPALGLAAVGGQVWRLSQDGTYIVFIPLADGGLAFHRFHVANEWDEGAESWGDFCARCARELLAMIDDSCIEAAVAQEFRDRIRYQVCLFPEAEYRSGGEC